MLDDVFVKNFAPSSLKNIRPAVQLFAANSAQVSSKKACHKKLPSLPCASDKLCTNADFNCCDT